MQGAGWWRLRELRRRGDVSSGVILFIGLIVIGVILVTWYIRTIQPTRQEISTVADDMAELRQHFANACGVTIYNASYVLSTDNARLVLNSSHYCVLAGGFGSCRPAPCALGITELSPERLQPLRIEKDRGGNVSLSLGR